MTVVRSLARLKMGSRSNQFLVLQNVKRGPIDCFRFLFSPMPQFAKYGGSPAAERTRAGDAPDIVWLASAIVRGLFNCPFTGLSKPTQPADCRQFLLQLLGEVQQVVSIVHCVGQHPFGQWPL